MSALVRAGVTLLLYAAVNLTIATTWHLVLFRDTLRAVTPFAREEPIIPFGMAAMVVQGTLLIGLYPRVRSPTSPKLSGLVLGALAGVFLASGAIWVEVSKFRFTDSTTYLALETIYEVLSFATLGLVVAWRHKQES